MKKFALALAFAAFACGSDDDPNNPIEDWNGEIKCGTANTKGPQVLKTYCAKCHQAPASKGGFDNILDTQALVDAGKIVPGDPDASPIYKKIKNNVMPPEGVQPRPSAYDVKVVRAWIACIQ